MKKCIVVIEDDRDILNLIQCILMDEGYYVVTFTRLVELKKIMLLRPSLVLLDIRLGIWYGDTLCNSIKSDPASKHIPVILVSALPQLEKIAAQCQADAFLPKPFAMVDLITMVKHYTNVYDTHLKSISESM